MSNPSGAALPRELTDFLTDFRIALHKHAIYPERHPALGAAVASVARRLDALLQEQPMLAIGVARHQFVIEGVATDPNNPVLGELAESFHQHRLSAVKLLRGIEKDELTAFLRALGTDPHRSEQYLGLLSDEQLTRWPHVRLYRQTYERLELVEEVGERQDSSPEGESAGRAVQLWLGLARAALAAEETSAIASSTDPEAVARAIDEHAEELAYDQVVVGYLLQIATELRAHGGTAGADLQQRVSRLVAALPERTLQRLLKMSGDVAQRRRFVLDATQGMAVGAVMTLVRTAAESSQQNISHSLMRLLTKLASHAEKGSPARRPVADMALREHVERFVAGWDLEDPNPEKYRAVLDHISHEAPGHTAAAQGTYGCEAERIVMMSLEVGGVGESVLDAADSLVAQGSLGRVLDLLDAAPADYAVAGVLGSRVATPEALRRTLAEVPIDFQVVDRLVARIGATAAEALLDALASADARATRRKLLERLEQLGGGIGPMVAARLPNPPWYVQRNLLVLMGRLTEWPEGFSPAAYAEHPEPRVRYEALKLLLKAPLQRDEAICNALTDPDERVVRLALGAALEGCPQGAVSRVVSRVNDGQADPELRALAIRVLAGVRSASTLELLLRFALSPKKWFRRQKLAPRSPEMLAALAGLAEHWKTHPKAAAALALAAAHTDYPLAPRSSTEVPPE